MRANLRRRGGHGKAPSGRARSVPAAPCTATVQPVVMSDSDVQHNGPRGGGGRAGAIRAWAIWWVLCAALWLALFDRVPLAGLVTGAAAATLGATAAVLVRGQRQTIIRLRARWLGPGLRATTALVTDLAPLARALVTRGVRRRPVTGTVHALPFSVVGDDPEELGLRVLTAALGSFGPNTIVIDIDTDSGTLYAHQLVSSDPAAAAMPLGGA
jgi:multisubunit Na+/H+ antiporter MnhE subunit